jgi:hypothetical protein
MGRVAEEQVTDARIGDIFAHGDHFANGAVAGYEGIVNLLQAGQLSQFGAGTDQAVAGPEQDVVGSKLKALVDRLEGYAANSRKKDFVSIDLVSHCFVFSLWRRRWRPYC